MTGILNARVLASVAMLVFVGAIVASATGAFFSDTETSTGNTFSAGSNWGSSFDSLGSGEPETQALTESVSEETEEVVNESGAGEEVAQNEKGNSSQGEDEGSVREGRESRGAREERGDIVPVALEARALEQDTDTGESVLEETAPEESVAALPPEAVSE